MTTPQLKRIASPGIMKFTILVDPSLIMITIYLVCLIYVFLLFALYRPSWEIFTHMETLPYRPTLGAYSHWVVRIFNVPQGTGHPVFLVYLRGPVTFKRLSSVQQWNCHYLFNKLGLTKTKFEHPTFCTANALPFRQNNNPPLSKCEIASF